jgi:hypothetical protein
MIRESVLSAVLSVPSKIKEIKQDTAMNENPVCFDCGAPYGVDGWCDVVIPNEIWNEIATDCGLLCFRCMTKRLLAAGKSGVPVIIASGPYVDANETWRQIGWDHGYAVCR